MRPSMLAETEIAPSAPLPLEASWGVVSTSWEPADASKYYRARYYDPKIGRFISEDPIGFDAGVNFYSYVANRPTLLIDPLGLQESPIGIGAERRLISQELGPEALAKYDADTQTGVKWGLAVVGAVAAARNLAPYVGPLLKRIWDDLNFEGPQWEKLWLYEKGRICQIRYKKDVLKIRLDIGRIPGGGPEPILHLNVETAGGANIHIPIGINTFTTMNPGGPWW